MIFAIILIALIIGLGIQYLKKGENSFLKMVCRMSDQQKALLLIQATVLRLSQEQNPLLASYAKIYMAPINYSAETCKQFYFLLLDQIGQFRKARQAGEKRFREMTGATETNIYTNELIQLEHGLRVWMQTIGTQCNMGDLQEVETLWDMLHEGQGCVSEVLNVLEEEHKAFGKMTGTTFLRGLSPEHVFIATFDRPQFIKNESES